MSTRGCSSVRARWQAKAASASSEPCMRLDMRLLPLARMMYSSPRRMSFSRVPSGERAWPSNCKAFTQRCYRIGIRSEKEPPKASANVAAGTKPISENPVCQELSSSDIQSDSAFTALRGDYN